MKDLVLSIIEPAYNTEAKKKFIQLKLNPQKTALGVTELCANALMAANTDTRLHKWSNESLTEDKFDLSDAEAEELFNSDEFKQSISEEEVEGYLNNSEVFESVFEDVDELDDESIQNCICEALTEVYDNIDNFVMESCEMYNGTFKINGTINFKSGNTTKTSYIFTEAKCIDESRVALNGLNETLSKDGSFVLEAKINETNKTMTAESLSYSYKIDNTLVEGLVKNNK